MNQLAKKLKYYQDKVSKILGEDWKTQQEGMELSKNCETLMSRLSRQQQEVFNKWLKPMLYLDYQYYTQKNVLLITQRGNKL